MEFLNKTTADPVAFFTAILAVATIGLWIATVYLLREARHTAKRQIRAYVDVTDVSIAEFELGKPLAVIVEIKNSGQTPARKVNAMAQVYSGPYPLLDELEGMKANSEAQGGSIAAGIQVHFSYRLGEPYSVDFQKLKESKNYGIWAHGEVSYFDVYGDKHITTFRYVSGGRLGGSYRFFPDQDGNSSS